MSSSILRGVERRSQAGSLGEQACDRGTRTHYRTGVARDGRAAEAARAGAAGHPARLRLPDHDGCRTTTAATEDSPALIGPRPAHSCIPPDPVWPPNKTRQWVTGIRWCGGRRRPSAFPAAPALAASATGKAERLLASLLETPLRADPVPETARSLSGPDLAAMSQLGATAMNRRAMNSSPSRTTAVSALHLREFYRTRTASTRPPRLTANDSPKNELIDAPKTAFYHP